MFGFMRDIAGSMIVTVGTTVMSPRGRQRFVSNVMHLELRRRLASMGDHLDEEES
jgi:hypothetical protein